MQRWMIFAVVVLLTGCGGSEYGADLRRRPEPLDVERPEARTWQLPGEQSFTITLKEASEQAELRGTASADATAEANGSGTAQASVTEGGVAAASFQVGHAFRNSSNRQVELAVQARMTLGFAISDGATEPLPLAGAFATLYARNNQNRTLAKFALLSHQSDAGDAEGEDRESVSFKLVLAPGETANVFVAGHTQISAEEGQTGSAEVRLNDLELDISVRPAPAIGNADDAGA